MPLIPLPVRSQPIANAPAPVMDRERRPTVDNRAVVQGLDQAARASEKPLIRPDALSGPYEALGSVGESISRAGSILGALAAKKQEALTEVQIAKGNNQFTEFLGKFDAWRESGADPSEWESEFQRGLPAAREQILSDDSLTPQSRERLALQLDRRASQVFASVQSESAKAIFGQARSVFSATIDNATEEQNGAKFEEALKTGGKRGYFHPHEIEAARQNYKHVGERKLKEAEAVAQREEYELAAAEAIKNPVEWLQKNEKPWKNREEVWARTKSIAQGQKRDGIGSIISQVQDGIASGNIKVPKDIDAIDNAFLSPEVRDDMKRVLFSRNEFEQRQDRETNGDRNAVALRYEIKDYSVQSDEDGSKYFNIRQRVYDSVPEGMREPILGSLDAKFHGRKAPVRPEMKQNIDHTLDRVFDADSGPYQWRTKTPGVDGYQTDAAKQQDAINRRTEIEIKMNDWLQEHPGAGVPEVQNKLNELVPEVAERAFLLNLKQKATPQASNIPVRGFQPADDLATKLPAGLKPHAQDFIDAARETGLNPRVLAAISALETAGGTSSAFRNKNNAMGISNASGPVALPSVRDSIFRQARTLARADGPYAKAQTLAQIGRIYAPPGAGNDFHGTNAGWATNVRNWYARL